MKLLTYSMKGRDFAGVLDSTGQNILPIEKYSSMQELIESGVTASEVSGLAKQSGKSVPLSDVTKRPPIPHPKQEIICLALNYSDHVKEAAKADEKSFGEKYNHAVYFCKRVSEAIADGGIIPGHWELTENTLDYENELALIIGKDAFHVSREDAYDYVFGYMVFNDVTARNLQKRHSQFYFGKSLDGFCPMGPWIVTEDEFSRPPSLRLHTRVNGESRQTGNTDMMIFDIPHIISELSKGITLKAGTIVATGTPSGVGMGFSPPQYLKPGDIVECEVEKIGILRNEIK